MNNPFFNSIELINLLARWKKQLMIVGLASLVLSAVFSSPFFIKPKFKSTAIVYPSNLIAYSTESATEQMLQITQSTDIRDKIIHAFNLYDHYEIDTTSDMSFRTNVFRTYDENVIIKKTEYESMEITVYDTDPIKAAQMADSIIVFFNIKARELQSEKSKEVVIISKNQMDAKKAEMDSMENALHNLQMKYNILDFKTQSKEASRAYLRSLNQPNSKANIESKAQLEALKDKGSEVNAYNEHLWRTRGTYNELKIVYENALRDVTKKLTYANVVTPPQPSDKKAYPIRWLIVLISVGSSLLMAFIIILIFYTKNETNKVA
ncbi:MAG TPA: hypothetical protein PLI47_02295 [Bacteroidia bacterium]|nr:hypothetical protein [Bacteroidota bacterium]HQW22102.1 hypothetical protein [Bacteroidia bacterium]